MKKIIVILIAVMMIVVMLPGSVSAIGNGDDNISVFVKTDKQYYKLGEPVKITFVVKNNGNAPVKLKFNNAQMYDFSIVNYGGGKLVYKWSKGKMFAQVITYLEIPANGQKEFNFTWNQKSNTGVSVTVGGYMVNFWLTMPGKTIVPEPGGNSPYFTSAKFEISSTVNQPFPDVFNPYQQAFVKKLFDMGLIKGYPDGTFKPDRHLTRAEAVTLILRLMHITPAGNYKQDFSDVPVNFWAFKFIEESYKRGIAKGIGNGKFSPNRSITRGEFTVMLIRALKFQYVEKANPFIDISPEYFGYKEIITAYYRGIALGVEKNKKRYFYPKNDITRGDAAVEMGRALMQFQSSSFSLIQSIEEKSFSAQEKPVSVSPNVLDYTAELDSVTNAKMYDFTEKQKEFLEDNGFLVKKSGYDTFEEFYGSNAGKPLFVSFDTFLQAYHTIFDIALRYDEINYFKNYLDIINKSLISDCMGVASSAPKSLLPDVIRDIEYLYVGEKLLDPDYKIPDFYMKGLSALYPDENLTEEIENKANAEIILIEAHKGFAVSPIFGYKEDYSQYVPRGHYTKTEDLKHYFKAMMWFGRMRFLLKPGKTKELIEMGRSQTRSAIILSLFIGSNDSLESLYDKIYEPTVFFIGKSDDLNFYNYLPIIKKIFGEKVSVKDLSDTDKIDKFINEALKLPNPKISTTGEVDVNSAKGFRLMGQRFTPDAYILQNLVYPKAGYRMMPKAMDVFFVFGNKTAGDILLNVYGEDKNKAYVSGVQELQSKFSQFTIKDWLQNLYWAWLSVLEKYAIGKRGDGYPYFMKNDNWAKKELVTALSSYAELKHDTILYAKQSYTTKSSMPILKPGYVEPNVEGFNRLITLLNMTENGLSDRGLLPKVLNDKIEFLKSLTEQALEISRKELQNEELSKNDEMYFTTFPDVVSGLFSFPEDFMAALGGSNEKVPLVADIHTDPNGGSVLEEGVGKVNTIFVVAPFNDEKYIFIGPVFSYYEFTEKLANRLTDEKWSSILKSGNTPEIPVWEASIIP
jgi:uncharacterized protein YxeA